MILSDVLGLMLPGFIQLVQFDKTMPHTQSYGGRTARVSSEGPLVVGQGTSVLLFVKGNTCLSK